MHIIYPKYSCISDLYKVSAFSSDFCTANNDFQITFKTVFSHSKQQIQDDKIFLKILNFFDYCVFCWKFTGKHTPCSIKNIFAIRRKVFSCFFSLSFTFFKEGFVSTKSETILPANINRKFNSVSKKFFSNNLHKKIPPHPAKPDTAGFVFS